MKAPVPPDGYELAIPKGEAKGWIYSNPHAIPRIWEKEDGYEYSDRSLAMMLEGWLFARPIAPQPQPSPVGALGETPRTLAMQAANGVRCKCADLPIELCLELEAETIALKAERDELRANAAKSFEDGKEEGMQAAWNSFANINDTCRSRGFNSGPCGSSTEDRVIALAQSHDKLKAETIRLQAEADALRGLVGRLADALENHDIASSCDDLPALLATARATAKGDA